jgi:hypothetical protein
LTDEKYLVGGPRLASLDDKKERFQNIDSSAVDSSNLMVECPENLTESSKNEKF